MTFLVQGSFRKDKKTIRLKWIACLYTLLSSLNLLYGQPGSLSGRVRDSLEQFPLGYASITLKSLPDRVAVQGVLADSLGEFYLLNPGKGKYLLEARFLGYAFGQKQILISNKNQNLDLGVISLRASTQLMKEVEISGKRRGVFHKVDRQVYNTGQFQQAQGGNATDILRNLPGMSIDAFGQISVRGSEGFLVMVDGRQIQMDPLIVLNQYPANAIETIEVITTPSAKFDPDGAAGIINITTKSGATNGLFLQVNGILGAPSIEAYENSESSSRYGGDITVSLKKKKWDLSLGLDYRRDDLAGRRIGYVNTYIDEVLTEYPSSGERSFDRERYSFRFSSAYKPNRNHELSWLFLLGDRTQYRTADILYDPQRRTFVPEPDFLGAKMYWELFNANKQLRPIGGPIDSIRYFNENLRVREGDFLIGGMDYLIHINQKSNLRVSVLYERTILGGPTDNASLAWPNISDTLQYQFNTNSNPLDGLRFKFDYKQKIHAVAWESGYQYRFLNHPGDFVYLDKDFLNGILVENPLFTNNIKLQRQIHSLYTQFSGKKNRLVYSVGIRAEYMDRKLELAKPDTLFSYQVFQPFPTINLQYDLGKNLSAKVGYSRRIERTTTFKMTPFPEREHNETLEQGDAELLPEFIDLMEWGLVKNWKDNSVYLSGYFRGVQNVINRVNNVFNDTILNRIYTNVGRSRSFGIEIGGNIYPTKWMNLYIGGNIYNYQIDGDLFGEAINTSNVICSLNANAKFSLGKGVEMQAAYNFLSRRVTAQGEDSRFYNPSLTLRKSFLEGKFSVALQWQSIDMGLLKSNEQRITTFRENFFTTTNYIYEVDRIFLSLSFKLNQSSKQMKFIKSEFGEKEY